jgi:acyl-CoA thioester hydrolase
MVTRSTPPNENPDCHLMSTVTLAVRFCETDLMGIVHHANYLVYMEAGRVDWLLRRGARYQAWMERGIHLPVVETRLRHRKAARFGDALTIETTCAELTRVTVRFRYRVLRGEELVCEGETLLACVGNDLVPRRFPEDVLQILRSPECA